MWTRSERLLGAVTLQKSRYACAPFGLPICVVTLRNESFLLSRSPLRSQQRPPGSRAATEGPHSRRKNERTSPRDASLARNSDGLQALGSRSFKGTVPAPEPSSLALQGTVWKQTGFDAQVAVDTGRRRAGGEAGTRVPLGEGTRGSPGLTRRTRMSAVLRDGPVTHSNCFTQAERQSTSNIAVPLLSPYYRLSGRSLSSSFSQIRRLGRGQPPCGSVAGDQLRTAGVGWGGRRRLAV